MTRRFDLLVAALLVAAPATAQESAYTTLAYDACLTLDAPEPGEPAEWVVLECEGWGDYPVIVRDSDGRMSLAYGFAPEELPWTSFQSFNRVHDTIEWRLREGRPFATVHRWLVSDLEGGERQVLVVSRVWQPDSAPGCRVGFVDAQANPDANVLARDVADRLALGFMCGEEEPRWHGATTARTPTPISAP
ncbi:hypothetical protein [Salinarimonas rosea]|uniref:hypothetical protein n=1 Tax=Salinarimonas rosea TaxID=552063 RepID=UPI0004108B31|nr:hypothetical protein [Salinarimonas rosea]